METKITQAAMAGVPVNFSEIVYSLKDLLLSVRRHMNCSLVLSVAHTCTHAHKNTHRHTQHTQFFFLQLWKFCDKSSMPLFKTGTLLSQGLPCVLNTFMLYSVSLYVNNIHFNPTWEKIYYFLIYTLLLYHFVQPTQTHTSALYTCNVFVKREQELKRLKETVL